jgi:hypothetical protein
MEINAYHDAFDAHEKAICSNLMKLFNERLPEAESKIWHAHPVWFLQANPVVGYSKLKSGIRVLFWSGQSFHTPGLTPEGKFKAAEVRLQDLAHCVSLPWSLWLKEAEAIQWDYKNIVKRKGQLLPLTAW